ncbi:serine/threonine-protein kinase [Smaragdicoccus niigatensis]|uniref:serine/threonine-protein kinase n=1 Tax=Smaragdicoccus niigatensis TaxID=359359 RepID=UPI0003A20F16|nr:serine/threonine-protein kinase [Smaragdicoccus niigatensis]
MDDDLRAIAAALPAYEIGGVIGKGGFGVVLGGRHRALDRLVAIKQLPQSFASNNEVRARFTAEGRLLASIDHPHVVRVFDYVEKDGLCLLVMEMLPGGTVWNRFTKQGLNAPNAVGVALATAAGLTAAHHKGILHRDIKPENLMFSDNGRLKVTDFGIAKVLGGDHTLATKTGEVIGTPSYIAPEQARGEALSPATDIYALSTLLYELLSGQLPFPRGDAMQQLFAHAYGTPIPLNEVAPRVPPSVAHVVMKGLATDPVMRFDTAEAFGVALAHASTAEWGSHWLNTQAIAIEGADSITAAAMTRSSGEPPAPPTQHASGLPPVPGIVIDHETAASEPIVRPSVQEHASGVKVAEVAASDLVPVHTTVSAPSAWPPFFAAIGFAAASLVVASIGLGTPVGQSVPRPATITIADHDPATTAPVRIDLNEAVAISGTGPAPGTEATLSLRVLGVPLRTQSTVVTTDGNGYSAVFEPLRGEYVVGGALTADLQFTDSDVPTKHWAFPVRTVQTSYRTVSAVAVLALLLFAFAYVESFGRKLRNRRQLIRASIGTVISMSLLGAGVVGAVWVAGGAEPTITSITATAILAGAAGAALAWGLARIGRKRHIDRVISKVQMTINLKQS